MSGESTGIRLNLIAIAALALLCLLFWADCLAGPYAPLAAGFQAQMEPWRSEAGLPGSDRQWCPLLWDGVAQFYPWRLLAARAVRDGELALWNPHQMLGYPFVGNGQSALFYPPNWLLAVVDVKWGMGLLAALHYALAATSTFLLGVALGLRRLPALFGAVAFTFGAFMVTWTQLPTLMNAITWLPAAMLGVALIFRGCRWGAPLLGLSLAMSLLAGHAQIAVYVWMVTGFYAAARAVWELVNRRSGQLLRLAAGAGLAVLLAAPQAVPMLELVRNSPRGEAGVSEIGWEFHAQRSVQPQWLVALLDPDAFGSPVDGDHLLTAQGIPYTEHSGFVGVTTVLLALLGLGFARTRHFAFFALLSVAALNIAMGGPLARALYWNVPLLGQAGSFSRFLAVWTFALPMMAAFGLDAVCGRLSRATWLRERLELPSRLLPGTLVAAVALALVGLELLPWAHAFLPKTERDQVYPVTPAIERMMAAEGRVLAVTPRAGWRMDRVPEAVLPPNAATVFGYDSTGGYDSLMPVGYRAFIEQAEDASAAPAANGNMVLPERAVGTRQALMGLSTVLASQHPGGTEAAGQVRRISGHGGVALYEVAPALPRAFLWRQERSDPAWPDDAGALAALMEAQQCAWQRRGRGLMEASLPEQRGEEVELVVFSETFYPGWNAYVEGQRREVEAVWGALSAVRLEPADRAVVLVFEPDSVRIGCFLGLVGLALLSGMIAADRRTGRDG